MQQKMTTKQFQSSPNILVTISKKSLAGTSEGPTELQNVTEMHTFQTINYDWFTLGLGRGGGGVGTYH